MIFFFFLLTYLQHILTFTWKLLLSWKNLENRKPHLKTSFHGQWITNHLKHNKSTGVQCLCVTPLLLKPLEITSWVLLGCSHGAEGLYTILSSIVSTKVMGGNVMYPTFLQCCSRTLSNPTTQVISFGSFQPYFLEARHYYFLKNFLRHSLSSAFNLNAQVRSPWKREKEKEENNILNFGDTKTLVLTCACVCVYMERKERT